MTKAFVTGATGFIGHKLTEKLLDQGVMVHALYRSESKIQHFQHPNLVWFKGSLDDRESLEAAMKDCKYVFHLAAFAKVWSKEQNIFYKSIYEGTLNIMEAAIKMKVEKAVITSTAGVFGPSMEKEMVDEVRPRPNAYFSDYEKYKDMTDRYLMENYTDKLNFCIVCPSRVYGPGELSDSNAATKLIRLYQAGKYHILPGNGKSVGNYVYVDDVVNGTLLALKNGKRGERYILGGDENVSYIEFFGTISEIIGIKYKLFKLPLAVMLVVSALMKTGAVLFKIPPLITPGWVRKFSYNWYVSVEKAKNELGYKPISLKQGIRKTLVWIMAQEEKTK
ncbi:MAG: NAD-dependent epimerase/dehydratase family protein [Bacteroidales bacterium]|nr:NAD-dependent epimerase/dehydratase family protein [Bacteroidales bacterium]